jgi:hypothetical protein
MSMTKRLEELQQVTSRSLTADSNSQEMRVWREEERKDGMKQGLKRFRFGSMMGG